MIVRKKSFKLKIIIPTVVVLVALVVCLNIFLSVRFSALSDSLVNEKLIANANSLKLHLDNSRRNSRVAAVSMALHPNTVKAIRERDRNKMISLFNPMKDLYRITFFTICDHEGKVLARTHEPGHFGDSILNLQNIKDALDGKISTYLESGTTVKVSAHTGAPVYDADGTLIGVVLAGVRFDTDSAVNELKQLFNSEVTVFLGDTRIATTIIRDGQNVVGTKIDPNVAEIVIGSRQEYSGDMDIFGEKYKSFYLPLINAENEVFATFFLGIPETEIIEASNKSIKEGIYLGLGGLIISIMLLFLIISSISEPIVELSNDMDHIANGNLRIEIRVRSEDEVGHLGKSLQKVVDIIHKLLDDINIMIDEHEKGNTDHYLDTEAFLGDYKILADNILELADLGMKDQLTGIPNRRSFDNRLELEWSRAVRENTPISILMLDVDKFKNYNDTYGHQQGDVALRTVAKTAKQSVKRTIDFAARWGGEEFVVLLPATDSSGAMSVAEYIRAEIEKAQIPCTDAGGEKVTVSVGVNTQIPTHNSSVNSFISAADDALYKAKEAGRNRVCTAETALV